MVWLAALLLWLVPPLLCLALLRRSWRAAGGWRVAMRMAWAIGATAGLVAIAGCDLLGLLGLGPWTAHPSRVWSWTVPLAAALAAGFAVPMGWACGLIHLHLRAHRRGGPQTIRGLEVAVAWLTVVTVLVVYATGLAYGVAALRFRQGVEAPLLPPSNP
jgi:hypothetical protein